MYEALLKYLIKINPEFEIFNYTYAVDELYHKLSSLLILEQIENPITIDSFTFEYKKCPNYRHHLDYTLHLNGKVVYIGNGIYL